MFIIDELAKYSAERGEGLTREEVAARIAPFDKDGDGLVDLKDIFEYVAAKKDFKKTDTDKNGELDSDELLARAEARGKNRSREQVEQKLRAHDEDGDGLLNFREAYSAAKDVARARD